MIGRASFGNPWCFLPGKVSPTLPERIAVMRFHAEKLHETKGYKGILEVRKHLVQYLRAFPGVKELRKALVTVNSLEDVYAVLQEAERIGE